jgi:predicted transcriptional regulator YdeE
MQEKRPGIVAATLHRMTRSLFPSRFLLAAWVLGCIAAPAQSPSTAVAMSRANLDTPFYVAGYLVRTNNADEAAGKSKIGPLWQRFMQEDLGAQIPNRADLGLVVVYSHYASDENGDYDYLLGARVTSVDNFPAGLTWRRVEPGPYAIIRTDKGPMPGVLQATWAHIWKMTSAELGGKRAYLTDYEVYDQRSIDPQKAQVEIHLGLAPTSP